MLKIKMLKRLIIFTVGLVALSGCSLLCGPNMSDVRVMKPMAQKISDYIVKNGIPETLKDIPDLPYGLVGCERSEEYWDNSNNKIKNIEKAFSFQIDEKCNFYYNNRKIKLSLGASKYINSYPNEWSILINMKNYETETVLNSGMALKKENNKFIVSSQGISVDSFKDDGICNPMRQ